MRKVVLVNLALFILLVGGAELFFFTNRHLQFLPRYRLNWNTDSMPRKAPKVYNQELLEQVRSIPARYDYSLNWLPEDELDYSEKHIPKYARLAALNHTSIVKTKTDGHIVYRVDYEFLPSGRRAVGPQVTDQFGGRAVEQDTGRPLFLALGDSNTFGEGVGQTENYPYFLSIKQNQFQVHNVGWHGAAPNKIIFGMQSEDRPFYVDIPGKGGVLAYLFIPPHLDRVFCPSKCLTERYKYLLMFPNYTADSDGNLVYEGSFQDSRPLLNIIYWLVNRSYTLDYFNFQLPLRYGDRHFALFARMMKTIKEDYAQTLKIEKFYFIFTPASSRQLISSLGPMLESAGFSVLDYSDVPFAKLADGQDRIPLDFHPSPKAYWLVAELLAQQLKLDFPQKPETQ